jgi:hypothetical protein
MLMRGVRLDGVSPYRLLVRDSRRFLRPEQWNERFAISPEQKEEERRNNEPRPDAFRHQKSVEKQNVHDDWAEQNEAKWDEASY